MTWGGQGTEGDLTPFTFFLCCRREKEGEGYLTPIEFPKAVQVRGLLFPNMVWGIVFYKTIGQFLQDSDFPPIETH